MRQNKSFIILASFLTAVIVISGIVLTTAKPKFDVPEYQLRIDTDVIELGGAFEAWSYVTNPSDTIERDADGPLHNVEVQYLTMTIIHTDRETRQYRFYPNGDLEDLINGWREPIGYELRWDPIVHPGETSLVFYSGWMFTLENGDFPGIYRFTYELCVEYDGTTYDLVNTFNINVREN